MGLAQSTEWIDKTYAFWKRLWKRDSCVLIVGLDNAGKTVVLYCLKLGAPIDYTVPTLGFNVEEINVGSLKIKTWDLGGQEMYRALWQHYFEEATGVAFVIDASDRDRFGIVKDEIQRLMTHEDLAEKPFLFLANKQDLPNAASSEELIEQLELKRDVHTRWHMVECCALKNERVQIGFEWLAEEI